MSTQKKDDKENPQAPAPFVEIHDEDLVYMPENRDELLFLLRRDTRLTDIDTSLITDMSWVFADLRKSQPQSYCRAGDFYGIEEWDTSSVRSMDGMFAGCWFFNSDISRWNTSNVTSMRRMFDGCEFFDQDLSAWDVSRVTDMTGMFRHCGDFRHSLEAWKPVSLTAARDIFNNGSDVTHRQNLAGFVLVMKNLYKRTLFGKKQPHNLSHSQKKRQ